MEVMSMIDKFLYSNLFLLTFDLDFNRIQLAERVRIFPKVGSGFIQDSEPNLSFRTVKRRLRLYTNI